MADPPVAMITGATRGIGLGLTEGLVARGWRVAALGQHADRLTALAAAFSPEQFLPLVADVTEGAAMAQSFAALHAIWRSPDLVIANAGLLTAVGPTWEADPDLWWRDVEVNVRGVQITMRGAIPGMVDRGGGRIIVMSSGAGRKPSPWQSAYGASKSAVTHLVSSVAEELAGTGVSVFAVAPGMVRTDMTQWPEALLEHRPDLANLPDSAYLPVTAVQGLVADLASGRFDALSGQFIHVHDDREALLGRAAGSPRSSRPPAQ